jgi:hypothetical protein
MLCLVIEKKKLKKKRKKEARLLNFDLWHSIIKKRILICVILFQLGRSHYNEIWGLSPTIQRDITNTPIYMCTTNKEKNHQ